MSARPIGSRHNARQDLHLSCAVCVAVLAAGAISAGRAAGASKPPDSTPTRPIRITLGRTTGKTISPLHFGANVEFFRPGIAHGVSDKQAEFIRALGASGIHTLRFPGGNAAYYYLPESKQLTLELAHSVGYWSFRLDNPPCSHFVTLEKLAHFCRTSGTRLIYQLPCLFYLDRNTPRAIIPSKIAARCAGLFDHLRVKEGVAYGVRIAARLRELGAPVAMWELGNEEFAHCTPEDYAMVVVEYIRQIRKLDPTTPIVAVGMGRGWLERLLPRLKTAKVMTELHSFQVHYPYGSWPGPQTPREKASARAFVAGDVRFERWLEAHLKGLVALGLPTSMPISATETMVMRHKNWDAHAIVPTMAHALCYAWNWMALLEHPNVDAAVFHDLETPYFGMMRYDVGFDPDRQRFVWLESATATKGLSPCFEDKYVLSPTCAANYLLARLVGRKLVSVDVRPSPTLRVLASRDYIVVVNRSPEPVAVEVPFARASAEALTADRLDARLPGTFRIAWVKVRARAQGSRITVPGWSVTAIKRS